VVVVVVEWRVWLREKVQCCEVTGSRPVKRRRLSARGSAAKALLEPPHSRDFDRVPLPYCTYKLVQTYLSFPILHTE
jgi:hypothetical protein